MENWTQAIYDATGIPLEDEDLVLAFREDQWWLFVHHRAVLAVGADPDPREAVTPAIRPALARVMQERLSETLPRVQRLVEALDPERAQAIVVSVVNAEDGPTAAFDTMEFERGWPHFLLRLSAGVLDVEVDLNPYVPEEPFEPEEVARQATVLLEAVGFAGGPLQRR